MILYEKEDNDNENKAINEENKNNIITESFLSNIQINIYLLKNYKIIQVSEEAWTDIENDINPKKRKEIIKERRLKEKESMFRPQSTRFPNLINDNNNITTITNKNIRPISSLTTQKSNSAKNIFKNPFTESKSTKPNYIYQSTSSFNRPGQEIITDKKIARNMKGKLIITKYTNNEGFIDIDFLPYDSYLIEVKESRQYMGIWMTLTFSNIFPKDYIIKKYIGLYNQENAFFEIHIYESLKNKEGKDDMKHISNCNVTLKKWKDNDNYIDDKEMKIKINEKSNGIFEYMILPGKYLLEVSKNNYETVRKFINLEKGYNNINIEMFTEKVCNLNICVLNYE